MLILQKQKSKSYFNYCIQGNICSPPPQSPVLFSPSLTAGEFKTGQIPMFQTLFLFSQLCLGELKTGRNRWQVGSNIIKQALYQL